MLGSPSPWSVYSSPPSLLPRHCLQSQPLSVARSRTPTGIAMWSTRPYCLTARGTWFLGLLEPMSPPTSGSSSTSKADGSLEWYKARWVLRWFTQRPEVGYDEIFSPVVKPATIRTVLTLAVSRGWLVHQLNVKNAFLHDTLSETVYCSQPAGFVDPAQPQLVCRLNKSLYGLKQAPRGWYHCFASYLVSLGFVDAKSDTSLFIYRCRADIAYLLLYVDDIILTASSSELLQRTTTALQHQFAMKDLSPLHHFLDISVEQRSDDLFLH
jgi:hypothetical protein